jgi:hypothetical protein
LSTQEIKQSAADDAHGAVTPHHAYLRPAVTPYVVRAPVRRASKSSTKARRLDGPADLEHHAAVAGPAAEMRGCHACGAAGIHRLHEADERPLALPRFQS